MRDKIKTSKARNGSASISVFDLGPIDAYDSPALWLADDRPGDWFSVMFRIALPASHISKGDSPPSSAWASKPPSSSVIVEKKDGSEKAVSTVRTLTGWWKRWTERNWVRGQKALHVFMHVWHKDKHRPTKKRTAKKIVDKKTGVERKRTGAERRKETEGTTREGTLRAWIISRLYEEERARPTLEKAIASGFNTNKKSFSARLAEARRWIREGKA